MDHGIVKASGNVTLKSIAGTVRYVGPSCTYTTIQSALTACVAGDTVLVMPGTYTEAITFAVDNVTLKAVGDYTNTIITQASAQVVSFSTMSGCVVEGFTVSVTAADGTTDYVIYSNNDDATAYNYVKNCKVTFASSVALYPLVGIYINDGNMELRDCIVTGTMTYAGTTSSGGFCILNKVTPSILDIWDCNITMNNSTTDGDVYSVGIYNAYASASTLNLWNTYISINVAGKTNHEAKAVFTYGPTYIYNSYLEAIDSDTGKPRCVYLGNEVLAGGIYNTTIKATSTDNDAECVYAGTGILGIYGGQLLGDGVYNPGTGVTAYGLLLKTSINAGYGVVSPATTGGSGTAGSGNQYFPMTVNGITYKILHDGTV